MSAPGEGGAALAAALRLTWLGLGGGAGRLWHRSHASRQSCRHGGAPCAAPQAVAGAQACRPKACAAHPCAACQRADSSPLCPPAAGPARPAAGCRSAQSRSDGGSGGWGEAVEGGAAAAPAAAVRKPRKQTQCSGVARAAGPNMHGRATRVSHPGAAAAPVGKSHRGSHRQVVLVLLHILLRHPQRVCVHIHPHHVLRPQHGRPDGQHRLRRAGDRALRIAAGVGRRAGRGRARQDGAQCDHCSVRPSSSRSRVPTVPQPRSITVCPSNSS